jgi:hypothetical protein
VNDEKSNDKSKNRAECAKNQPHCIRLPGFLIEAEIGLGDAVKGITYAMGIKPCDGCEKRANALNRWMRFTR